MDKALLIDLDGTIYKGKQSIPGSKPFVEWLESKSIPYLFVTNNATRSHKEAAAFLATYHDIHVSPEHFYTSVDALKFILEQQLPLLNKKQPTAFVIGRDYIQQTVREMGIKSENQDFNHVDFVILSLDDSVTYADIQFACLAIQHGASFILTNPDIQFPSPNGFIPGAGALGELIAMVTKKQPIVCGKPETTIIEGALSVLNRSKEQAICIGDNLLTDIQAGINADVETVLLETGVHNRQHINEKAIYPDEVIKNYSELQTFLKEK